MNVTAAIYMHARLRPRAPAVITPKGSLTFAQLDAAVWRVAARFRTEGLEAGQTVVVDISDSVKHLIVALALGRIGVAHLAVVSQQGASVAAPLIARLKAVRTISGADVQDDESFFGRSNGTGEDWSAAATLETVKRIAAEMMNYGPTPWLYATSSATTGRAKILAITHMMMLQRCARHVAGVPVLASDRYLPLGDLAFHSPKRQVMGTLNVGGCVAFAGALDVGRALEFIQQARVTRISCGPVHLHRLCAVGKDTPLLPGLRALEALGSMVTDDLRRRVRQAVSRNLYVNYGSSETSAVTVAPPEVETVDSVGSALPGVRLQIVDAADKPLPRGEAGIIRIRAPGMIQSYFDDAEATAKAFRGGWFYPGDLGVLTDDEQLIFKGRADDMMLFDGINIYPAEIEAVLAAHEAVREAAAFPVASEVHHDIPVAAVTLRAPVTEGELLAFCRSHLGSRAPQRIVAVEEFPRSAAGKILKRQLPELLQRRSVSTAKAGSAAEGAAPAATSAPGQ